MTSYVALKFLSEAKLTELLRNVSINRERYSSGDFLDLERENGWAIDTSSVQVDNEALRSLDGSQNCRGGFCKLGDCL